MAKDLIVGAELQPNSTSRTPSFITLGVARVE